MTYRERRAARAERLRDWADSRAAKAQAAYAAASEYIDNVPLGQLGPELSGRGNRSRPLGSGVRARIRQVNLFLTKIERHLKLIEESLLAREAERIWRRNKRDLSREGPIPNCQLDRMDVDTYWLSCCPRNLRRHP